MSSLFTGRTFVHLFLFFAEWFSFEDKKTTGFSKPETLTDQAVFREISTTARVDAYQRIEYGLYNKTVPLLNAILFRIINYVSFVARTRAKEYLLKVNYLVHLRRLKQKRTELSSFVFFFNCASQVFSNYLRLDI